MGRRSSARKPNVRAPRSDWVARIGAAAIGWAIPVGSVALGRVNLLRVWSWNYRNHAGFYEHYTRTYWKWLLVNPIELAFALAAPLVLAAVLGIAFRELRAGWRRRAAGPYWCLTAVWVLLWLSGKNMGEAARLWLILMPWAVWLSAGYFEAMLNPPRAAGRRPSFAVAGARAPGSAARGLLGDGDAGDRLSLELVRASFRAPSDFLEFCDCVDAAPFVWLY